jgi:hypothetical protein
MSLDGLAVFTLEDFKGLLRIPEQEETDDTALTLIGNGVSAYVDARTGTKWKKRTYTITRDGDGRSTLLRLPRPIASVASLTVDGTPLVQGQDFWVYGDSGKIALQGRTFPCGFQNVVVTLDAGYDVVPYDIVEAALELAKSAYDELKTGAVSLSSISIGSVNAILKPGLNPRIEKFLDAHRDLRG